MAISASLKSPRGLGRSRVVDPEGLVRVQAGESEEMLTDVLEMDAVTRVCRFGTAGVSRMWDQLQREGVPSF